MYVIALVGESNRGKTTTLNIVHQYVLENGGESKKKKQLGGQANDFSDTVFFQNRKIMFYTMGDYADIGDYMATAYYESFDIFVCAINISLKGPLQDILDYPNRQISKTVATDVSRQIAANTRDARWVYSSICEVAPQRAIRVRPFRLA